MFHAKVFINLKESILDPQGVSVKKGLANMNYSNVDDVRVGKMITLNMNSPDRNSAEIQLKEMCDKLLSNPVIENYTYEIMDIK